MIGLFLGKYKGNKMSSFRLYQLDIKFCEKYGEKYVEYLKKLYAKDSIEYYKQLQYQDLKKLQELIKLHESNEIKELMSEEDRNFMIDSLRSEIAMWLERFQLTMNCYEKQLNE